MAIIFFMFGKQKSGFGGFEKGHFFKSKDLWGDSRDFVICSYKTLSSDHCV